MNTTDKLAEALRWAMSDTNVPTTHSRVICPQHAVSWHEAITALAEYDAAKALPAEPAKASDIEKTVFDVLDPYGAEMRQLQDDEASARMELRRIIAARMPSVTFRPITDEDIDAIGSALYIYWFDVKERARDKYREKVCGALESVLPHGMPVVVGE